jgi:response regulator of citrate/malate metabolism
MRYYVFVVVVVKGARVQDEGLHFRITFQAQSLAAAKRIFNHYFKDLVVLDIVDAPVPASSVS